MGLSPIGALLLVIAALNLSIGIYIVRRSPSVVMRRAFGLLAGAIAAWALGVAFSFGSEFVQPLTFRFTFAAGSLIPLGVLAFAQLFPGGSVERWPLMLKVCTPVAVVFAGLSFSPWIVSSMRYESFRPQPIYGPLHFAYALYVSGGFVVALWVLARKVRESTGVAKLQARYLLIGLVLPFAAAIVTNLAVPLVFRSSALSSFGPFFSLAHLAIFGHAIIRHRLMDIRIVIRRGAVYVGAVLAAALIFVLLMAGANALLPAEQDLTAREVLLALLVAVLFFPVKRQVQRLFDRYLYRDPYDYQRTVREASRALTGTIELPALLGTVGGIVTEALRPEGVATYLQEEDEPSYRLAWATGDLAFPESLPAAAPLLVALARDRQSVFRDEVVSLPAEQREGLLADLDRMQAEVVVPLIEADDLAGFLVVGLKRSGDPYFSDDADLLSTLANQSAVAVRNAQTHARVVRMNQELQKILGTIESGVVAVGARGRVTLFNRAAEQLTGVPAQAARGREAGELPAPLGQLLADTVADGQSRSQVEFALPDAAGQIVPLVCSTSPILGPEGGTAGAVAVVSDLSRLKELEQEKRRAERLASLEAIASGLVHEIRNPLVALKTFAQLLPVKGESADFRETFSRSATREIGRIDELLTRFRTLARPTPQAMEPVDILAPLRHALDLLRPRFEDRQIGLRLVAGGTPRPIQGNASQLEQLFLNLCLNALEAMEPGGELTVRVADLCEAGGSTLLVEVSDTGPGIPEEMLGRIFDPFVTGKAHGTGLGLAISRAVADAHRARLQARNNVGRSGATFTVEFPVPAGRTAQAAT